MRARFSIFSGSSALRSQPCPRRSRFVFFKSIDGWRLGWASCMRSYRSLFSGTPPISTWSIIVSLCCRCLRYTLQKDVSTPAVRLFVWLGTAPRLHKGSTTSTTVFFLSSCLLLPVALDFGEENHGGPSRQQRSPAPL